MTIDELKSGFLSRGYEVISKQDNIGYMLIPIKDPHCLWDSFENKEALEKFYLNPNIGSTDKPEVKHTIYVPDTSIPFWSLKDEVQHCLDNANIEAHVHGAKRGEHHVRITSKTNIDGMRFDNGRHIISICLATTMFGDTYYIGGRVK